MKFMRVFIIAVFGLLLLLAAVALPRFGTWGSRDIARYYIEHGAYETGSASLVNAIVWDFRGYDTMGEETVLFTAALGVFLIMRRKQYGYYRKVRK